MITTRHCPVARMAFPLVQMRQKETIELQNGRLAAGPPQLEQQVQYIQHNYHEFRQLSGEDYTFFCIYCGQSATQVQLAGLFPAPEEQKSAGS